jgi:hypothetical protein
MHTQSDLLRLPPRVALRLLCSEDLARKALQRGRDNPLPPLIKRLERQHVDAVELWLDQRIDGSPARR